MRPNHCRTALHASVLAVLFLTLNADSEDSECSPVIEVRRNTVYNVSIGKELRIKCPVTFCNNTPPKVSWFKIEGRLPFNISRKSHFKTEWKMLDQSKGEAYLILKNALENNAGVYQCEITGSMSHLINVYVYDPEESSSVTQISHTKQKDGPNLDHDFAEGLMLYLYCGAGITSFVIIVIIISIVAMKGCKGKSKKEAQSENNYMSMPMANLRLSPRGSPCLPPSRRSTKRKSPSRQPDELRSSRNDEQLYDQIKEDRNRRRQEEESGSVVYAALNHELPQRPAARRPRPVEEQSEYAAIRLV